MSDRNTVIAVVPPGSVTHTYENMTPSEIMRQITGGYECRETSSGFYEHKFMPQIRDTPWETCAGPDDMPMPPYSERSIITTQRDQREIAAKQRKRRKCRAAFRRRKRGLA
jgi:hypothetical protein